MAASLTNDLAHLLTEKGVDADIQDKFGEILVTNVRLFALVAESRTELKVILKEPPFALDPMAEGVPAPDRIKMRVSIAQITDAWLSATARFGEKTRVEAEQRAVGVPLALPQSEHVDMKQAYETKYRRINKVDYPSDALVERRLTEIEQGDLRADSLQDVSTKDEQTDDPQDAVCYMGVYKIKRAITKVKLPQDSEELRHRLGVLGITYCVARLRHPTRNWLETSTPALFADHAAFILGKDVHKSVVKVNGVEHRPPWTLVLSYELEVRKAAIELVCYDSLNLAAALKKVYGDTEHRQRHFLTPCMASVVTATSTQDGYGKASANASTERPAPYTSVPPIPRSQMRKMLKGAGKGEKGRNRGKDGGKAKGKGGDWHSKTEDGKSICFRYNTAGKSCNGKCGMVHCCQRCLEKHPAFDPECKKAD